MSRRVSLALSLSAAAVLLVAGGCQSSKARDIRLNPTPELDTLAAADAGGIGRGAHRLGRAG